MFGVALAGTGGQLPVFETGLSCVAIHEAVHPDPTHCHDHGAPPATVPGVGVP